MKLELTVEERAFAMLVPKGVQGTIADIRPALQALDSLDFTEEERNHYAIEERLDGGISWSPASRNELTAIEIAPRLLRWLHQAAQKYTAWPARPCVLSLFDKLGKALEAVGDEE